MSSRNERIMKEFNQLKNSKCISIVKCEFINGDMNNCPNGRPYLYFITKMFHPNINPADGCVSLNLMYEWVPTRTIEEVFFGFLEVMENPRVGRGGGEPAKLLAENRDKFFEKVREYTIQFAMDDDI